MFVNTFKLTLNYKRNITITESRLPEYTQGEDGIFEINM